MLRLSSSPSHAKEHATEFRRRPPAKGVGLRVADSHTGNHPEDDFTPLKTIRRSYSVIREKIPFELEGETFESERWGEFNDFLALYPIPSEYHVILPKSNQTVFDAPPGYVRLYTHSFSLVNLKLPLTEFFCEVLKYFQVNISRLNPFGCAKLTTFVVMCKAYGCEPSVDLFRGFFNLCRAGKWLTFAKRSEKHILNLLPKVITRIEEMAFRNFIYTEDDKDLAFLPKEPFSGFGTGSPSISVNTKPLKANEEPEIQPVECKTRGGSSRPPVKRKLASGSSTFRATRAKTSSSKDDAPFLTVSDDDEGLPDVSELKDAAACHLKISAITPPAGKNHLDNHMDFKLLDLHDHCYARQAVVDNAMNRRSRELLQVIEKLRGKCDVMRSRERAREEECEGLRVKCEAAVIEMMLESQKSAGYQQSLSSLEWKVTSLEAEKARLEAVEVSLRKEVEELKQDMREVVSKEMRAFEQVADMKEPFNLSKVKDPSAPIEALLSKKPPTLQRPAPSKTHVPLPSS
ncbi:hypothetical protein Tco_1034762 [Tanacetum coccineum]